jgi:hypothetical protein
MKAPRLTTKYLIQCAWTARDKIIGGRDAEEGDCEPVAEEMIRLLKRDGHRDAQAIYGSFMNRPHEWVIVGNFNVDPTRDQFRYYAETDEEENKLVDNPIAVWRT